MPQVLIHGYSSPFTLASASATLPAFTLANTDANCALMLKKYRIGMSGTGAASVTVQIAASNAGASAAGTSTAATSAQVGGRAIGVLGVSVANQNYTAARTSETYTIIDEITMVNNQTVIYDYPWGDEPDCPVGVATFGAGFHVFFTAGTPVSSTVDLWVVRI